MGAFSAFLPIGSYMTYVGTSGIGNSGRKCKCPGNLIEISVAGVAQFISSAGILIDACGCYMCSDCGLLPFTSGVFAFPAAVAAAALSKPDFSIEPRKPEAVKSCECGAKKTYKAPPKSNLHSSWCPEA